MPIARRPVLAAGFGLLLGSGRAGAADVIVGSGTCDDAAPRSRRFLGRRARRAVLGRCCVPAPARPSSHGRREPAGAHRDPRARLGQRPLARDRRRAPRAASAAHAGLLTVDFVRLDAIALGGSGTISGKALKSPRLGATIGGSGTIALSEVEVDVFEAALGGSGVMRADGHARKLSVDIGGSGRCDLERLIASDVSVSVAGTGETRVHADATLSVAVAGSGNVYYAGAATPRVSSVGSGRVVRL